MKYPPLIKKFFLKPFSANLGHGHCGHWENCYFGLFLALRTRNTKKSKIYSDKLFSKSYLLNICQNIQMYQNAGKVITNLMRDLSYENSTFHVIIIIHIMWLKTYTDGTLAQPRLFAPELNDEMQTNSFATPFCWQYKSIATARNYLTFSWYVFNVALLVFLLKDFFIENMSNRKNHKIYCTSPPSLSGRGLNIVGNISEGEPWKISKIRRGLNF